jgi:hypothetical protein
LEAWEESFQNGEEPDHVPQFVNQTVPDFFFPTGCLLAESSPPSHFFSPLLFFLFCYLMAAYSPFKIQTSL